MIYPIGVQDFESLRNDGYVYVDKTSLVYKLVSEGRYYFLSRPRRFGKSLLLSTFEAYFRGKKELFCGLAIEKLETKWESYPILHLDLNVGKYLEKDSLDKVLEDALVKWEQVYGREESETTFGLRFKGIVERASVKSGRRAVILVDEYDKPMLQSIGNEELQGSFRNTLKEFYSVLKTQDRYIKFAFLTGVTKFGKVSVFSDLNNLEDISMLKAYNGICGISEEELHRYFDSSIKSVANELGVSFSDCCEKLRAQYDGYHFSANSIGIYNPFSLLNVLKNKELSDYWFETGTPTFLVELLKKSNYNLANLTSEQQTSDMINSIDSTSYDPVPVIYQSGYLTIKDYDAEFGVYTLGFPNQEVERGFIKYLLPFYTPHKESKSEFFVNKFVSDVRNGNPEQFLTRLQTLYDSGDYSIQGDRELYFQNTMWAVFKVMGFYVDVERKTSRGRIDMVIKTSGYIYVIEMKLDGTPEDALLQIDEKGYAAQYRMDGRKVWKIGINFSSADGSIGGWKVEEEDSH
ncbi:MAG: ATP-binding protein [Bacteroidales bacterium]|nr:ATP-binding protein [Bacteroidales bacterium]